MNISSQTPFNISELSDLYHQADILISKYYPDAKQIFQDRDWSLPKKIDRVYVIDKARKLLGFKPSLNFMECLTDRDQQLLKDPCIV